MAIPKIITIYTCRDQAELTWMTSKLENQGIKVFVIPLVDSAFDGIYAPQRGIAQLQVYQKDALIAEQMIKDLKNEISP